MDGCKKRFSLKRSTGDQKRLNRLLFAGKDGWKDFWRIYGPVVEAKVATFGVSREDQEDIVQEFAFLVVRENFKVLKGWDHERSSLAFYLQTIVSNLCINHLRGGARRAPGGHASEVKLALIPDQANPTPREANQSPQHFERLHEIFESLFDSNQVKPVDRVLFQHRLGGCSYAEIAANLRLEEAAVRKKYQRLKKTLAEEIRKSKIHLSERDIAFINLVTDDEG